MDVSRIQNLEKNITNLFFHLHLKRFPLHKTALNIHPPNNMIFLYHVTSQISIAIKSGNKPIEDGLIIIGVITPQKIGVKIQKGNKFKRRLGDPYKVGPYHL